MNTPDNRRERDLKNHFIKVIRLQKVWKDGETDLCKERNHFPQNSTSKKSGIFISSR
jgi:hypothetical protein